MKWFDGVELLHLVQCRPIGVNLCSNETKRQSSYFEDQFASSMNKCANPISDINFQQDKHMAKSVQN